MRVAAFPVMITPKGVILPITGSMTTEAYYSRQQELRSVDPRYQAVKEPPSQANPLPPGQLPLPPYPYGAGLGPHQYPFHRPQPTTVHGDYHTQVQPTAQADYHTAPTPIQSSDNSIPSDDDEDMTYVPLGYTYSEALESVTTPFPPLSSHQPTNHVQISHATRVLYDFSTRYALQCRSEGPTSATGPGPNVGRSKTLARLPTRKEVSMMLRNAEVAKKQLEQILHTIKLTE